MRADHIRFDGRDLLGLDDEAMREVRGGEIAMIFQEPMTSLQPPAARRLPGRGSVARASGAAAACGAGGWHSVAGGCRHPDSRVAYDDYPHLLSGGMRQRVMIAMAMACRPRLLVADEPTTALDVTIQAQILALMRRLRTDRGSTILFITHDMGVIAQMADRVAVMYAGQIVETAPTRALLTQALHPYTRLLLAAIPTTRRRRGRLRGDSRSDADAGQHCGRLPFPCPLPDRGGALRGGTTAARAMGRRPHRPLLACRRASLHHDIHGDRR